MYDIYLSIYQSFLWANLRIGDFVTRFTTFSPVPRGMIGQCPGLFPSQLPSTLADGIGIAMNRHADRRGERCWHDMNRVGCPNRNGDRH